MVEINFVVTGATGNIGYEVVKRLSSMGEKTISQFSTSSEVLTRLQRETKENGEPTRSIQADFSSYESVREFCRQAIDIARHVDCRINCVGISKDAPFLDLDIQDWERVISVNLNAAFVLTQEFGRNMVSRGRGNIVHVSAITAEVARKNAANYCASKAGLNMLTKCAALELGPDVRVNSINLGFVESDLLDTLYSESELSEVKRQTPVGRFGTVVDVFNLIEFLIDDRSDFITGQCIVLDGGRIMHRQI